MLNQIKIFLMFLSQMKLRTILAILGVLVGTASVVAMVSSGEMATEAAIAQFKTLGTDMMSVDISDSDAATTQKKDLTLNEALHLRDASSAIELAAPYIVSYVFTSYKGATTFSNVIGATNELADVIHIKMIYGRFVSIFDEYQPFCVLGYTAYQKLKMDGAKLIGSQFRLGGMVFTIIGIADNWPENAFFDQNVNEAIFVPIKAASLLSKQAKINNIVMRLKPDVNLDFVQADITSYFQKTVPNKKLFFRSSKQLIESMTAQQDIFTILLGCIGGISLLVGGIGVMNIMLVSVLERKREIGIRLAVGAKRRDIRGMFLRESMLLSVAGGLLGVITGLGSSFIIAAFAHWEFQVFLWPPLIGFVVSVLTGVVSGYYPAVQASRLNPIETLHAE